MRATSCRPHERQLVVSIGDIAGYEPWPADCYPPWRRPTQFEFRDPKGAWDGLSDPLKVFQNGVAIRVPRAEYNPHVGGDYAGAHGEVGMHIRSGEEMEILLDVTVDPEVELFAFSPAQEFGGIPFENYVETSLAEFEEALAEEQLSGEGIREVFIEDYGDFIGEASGLIFVSFEPERTSVEPGETSRVTATLHGEREGGMLLVLGARHLGTGEVFFSDLLPLIWRPMEEAARASHEEVARKQETLRRGVAKVPRLKPRGDANSLEGRAGGSFLSLREWYGAGARLAPTHTGRRASVARTPPLVSAGSLGCVRVAPASRENQ